ncbi:unnamed protein product [Allacma fusca]|uniref:Uncharacterized protein n=1 Tax=Allacma fusca TaxID=39272 RepID=A0A8J2PRP8_9HEXA|nr:unnamed protein product [Allacma fusca]
MNMPKRQSSWENYRAVKDSSIEVIRAEHLKKNFDPNTNFRGQTLLTTSVIEGRADVVQLLLEMGANPNLKSDEGGRRETPLITAVRLKKYSCVKILTSKGALISTTNFYGQNAVYQAVVENAYEILQHFLGCPLDEGKHYTQVSCPFHLALTESLMSHSKKKCLLLLLRFNYNCPCIPKLCTRICPTTDSHASSYRSQDMIKVDPDVFKWIYLSLGYPPLPLRLSQIKDEVEEKMRQFFRGTTQFQVKLQYLVRIYVREICSIYSLKLSSSRGSSIELGVKNKISKLNHYLEWRSPDDWRTDARLRDLETITLQSILNVDECLCTAPAKLYAIEPESQNVGEVESEDYPELPRDSLRGGFLLGEDQSLK